NKMIIYTILGATLVPAMQHGHDQSMDMKGMALFYDTETNELIKKVEVGHHPAHIVFTENSPDFGDGEGGSSSGSRASVCSSSRAVRAR
ncbi:hypothetical protein P4531_14815, partial [Geobacillus stearothermophilus]|nr:hypothetical protein [Geobacillus stearothermophilus]MED3773368.1 hypothetical protein [Geobacillus stearothermophilus]